MTDLTNIQNKLNGYQVNLMSQEEYIASVENILLDDSLSKDELIDNFLNFIDPNDDDFLCCDFLKENEINYNRYIGRSLEECFDTFDMFDKAIFVFDNDDGSKFDYFPFNIIELIERIYFEICKEKDRNDTDKAFEDMNRFLNLRFQTYRRIAGNFRQSGEIGVLEIIDNYTEPYRVTVSDVLITYFEIILSNSKYQKDIQHFEVSFTTLQEIKNHFFEDEIKAISEFVFEK